MVVEKMRELKLDERIDVDTDGLSFIDREKDKRILCYCMLKRTTCFDVYKYRCPNYRELVRVE